MESIITLAGVTKTYGTLVALDGVDLQIDAGQTVAVLGPNGAGKTTAISLMLGLRPPTRGTVQVFGRSPKDRAVRSAMGVMLQASGLPEYLTVREAIELFRTYYPAPLSLERILDLAGLGEKTDARIARLSGGQVQRLYFALAICGDPRILILDEPTVGMDVEARRAMHDTIRDLAADGRTILLTTHYMEEADALADRIVVINRGHILADDAPEAIKSLVARKRVSFRAAGIEEAWLLSLGAALVERADDRWSFFCDRPEVVVKAVLNRTELSDLTVTGASLEEAFVTLTSRSENDHVA